MVARFLYRLASLVFLLLAVGLWLVGVAGIVLQFVGDGSQFLPFAYTIMAFICAMMAGQISGETWRAARYHHIRY